MNQKSYIFIWLGIIVLGFYCMTSFINLSGKELKDDEKVLDVLAQLGDEMPLHYISKDKLEEAKIKEGEKLVLTGFSEPNEQRNKAKQSKHFVCTDCHNVRREDPDLKISNPDARLDFIMKNKLNFLPGTTIYGTVNKKNWYNQDYKKKYGELVSPARDTLKNAIQLCAKVCSQGRVLNDKEMESVMHYFNTIGYSVSDLNLSDEEKKVINKSLKTNKGKEESISLIKSKYLDYSPATFLNPLEIEKRKFGKTTKVNLEKGKYIYEYSCLHCHKQEGVTNYKLNNEKLTFKHLKFWSKTHKIFSVYDITRKGTHSMNGYKPYMPNYTKERLSSQQLEDLVAYIFTKTKKKKKYKALITPSF